MSDIIFCLNSATLKTSLHVGMVAVSLWTKNVMNEKIALMGVMKILAASLSRKKKPTEKCLFQEIHPQI